MSTEERIEEALELESDSAFQCPYCGVPYDSVEEKDFHVQNSHKELLSKIERLNEVIEKESESSGKTPYQSLLEDEAKRILSQATLEDDYHFLNALKKDSSLLEKRAKENLMKRSLTESKHDSFSNLQERFRQSEIARIQHELDSDICPSCLKSGFTDVDKEGKVIKRLTALEHLQECAKTDRNHAETLRYFEKISQMKLNPKFAEEYPYSEIYYTDISKYPKAKYGYKGFVCPKGSVAVKGSDNVVYCCPEKYYGKYKMSMSQENLSESEQKERQKAIAILSALLRD